MQPQVGIVVGRFQVAELHDGHKALIQTAIDNSQHVIVFLGSSREYFTERNPLPYYHRKMMIVEQFPNVQVQPLADVLQSDHEWVKNLEQAIKAFTKGTEKIVLYGGRDSFIDIYKMAGGKYQCYEVPEVEGLSGTKERTAIKNIFYNSVDFRKGIIYTVLNPNPNEI